MDKQVAPLYSLGVCKTYKLLHNTLVAKVLQQIFFIVVFTQFRTVAVGILEAELQNQSLVAYFYQVRRYSGCVLRNEYVRHNATAAVYGSAQTGRVTQVFVQFDAVFGEELAVFVTGNPVHFVFAVLAVLVGALDATARWGVITGNGQADGGTVTEVDGLLYESLAEGTASYNGSAVIVLNGTCKDFAGRSGAFVHQYYQRQLLATAGAVGIFLHAGVFAAVGIYYQLSFRQEFVHHARGGFHVASGIVAQVNNQAFALLVAQLGNRIQQLHVCGTSEFADLYISVVIVEHIGCVNGVLRDVTACDGEVEQFLFRGTLDA